MPTIADRVTQLEGKVQYLELREQLLTGQFQQAQKAATEAIQRTEAELSFQRTESNRTRDELSKLRDEFAAFRVSVSSDTAVHTTELTELKKHREHWSQRAWQVGAGVLLAVVGGVIGYLLKR